jgi:aminoglycoside 6'-N-acetyltransferase I
VAALTAPTRVRHATAADADAWWMLRKALWPDEDALELRAEADAFFRGSDLLRAVFICEDGQGRPLGMLELSLRPYADGCRSSPVPYVEGWYVAPDARGGGVGGALMRAAERWAAGQGFTELASDALVDNEQSERAHKALGFDEVERRIQFRKALRPSR